MVKHIVFNKTQLVTLEGSNQQKVREAICQLCKIIMEKLYGTLEQREYDRVSNVVNGLSTYWVNISQEEDWEDDYDAVRILQLYTYPRLKWVLEKGKLELIQK